MDHPNIVKYYETYDDVKYMYLVMEYCSGGELFDKLSLFKNVCESEICKYIKRIVRAINHCHAHGIVHRDIKPENVVFSKNNDIKLIDFGLAKISNDQSFIKN